MKTPLKKAIEELEKEMGERAHRPYNRFAEPARYEPTPQERAALRAAVRRDRERKQR